MRLKFQYIVEIHFNVIVFLPIWQCYAIWQFHHTPKFPHTSISWKIFLINSSSKRESLTPWPSLLFIVINSVQFVNCFIMDEYSMLFWSFDLFVCYKQQTNEQTNERIEISKKHAIFIHDKTIDQLRWIDYCFQ